MQMKDPKGGVKNCFDEKFQRKWMHVAMDGRQL